MANGTMAKGRPSKSGKVTKTIFVMKGSVEWANWLERFCQDRRMPIPVLVDHLLAEEARRLNFEPPPER